MSGEFGRREGRLLRTEIIAIRETQGMKLLKAGKVAVVLSSLIVASAMAHDNDESRNECTAAAMSAADAYDPGSSAVTNCIKVRKGFKVVVAWNSAETNGAVLKNTGQHVGQQVVNSRNLTKDYASNYGMTAGEEYKMVVVAYGNGVDWLKKANDQADVDMVNGLLSQGIKIYACQNTMKSKNLKVADLIEGVELVPSGVSAVVDFENQRYTYLNP